MADFFPAVAGLVAVALVLLCLGWILLWLETLWRWVGVVAELAVAGGL